MRDAVILASQKPDLVILQLKAEERYLRPMVRIVGYGNHLILYDFLSRDSEVSDGIHPIRVVRREDVKGWISAGALPRAKGIPAVRQIIASVCPTARNRPASSNVEEELQYIRETFVDGDFIYCEPLTAVQSPHSQPLVEAVEGIRKVVDGIAVQVEQINGEYPRASSELRQSLSELLAGMSVLLATYGAKAPEPPAIVVNLPDHSYAWATGDRWERCSPELPRWSDTSGLQFINGGWTLAGPEDNQLLPNRTSRESWRSLEAVFRAWTDEIVLAQIRSKLVGKPYLVLIGRASENGDVVYNDRLTEKRARAVKNAILTSARPSNWEETGLRPEQIIAVGEGETALVPRENPFSGEARRVDARLCFISSGELNQETASVVD